MSLHVSLPGNLHTGTCTCIICIFESRLSISSSYDGYSELITLYSPLNCNPLFWNPAYNSPVLTSCFLCNKITVIMKSATFILKYCLYWGHWSVPSGDNKLFSQRFIWCKLNSFYLLVITCIRLLVIMSDEFVFYEFFFRVSSVWPSLITGYQFFIKSRHICGIWFFTRKDQCKSPLDIRFVNKW